MKFLLLFIVTVFIHINCVYGQQELEIDLGAYDQGAGLMHKQTIPAGKYDYIVLKNSSVNPTITYEIDVDATIRKTAPLDPSILGADIESLFVNPFVVAGNATCHELEKLTSKLSNEVNEKSIENHINFIENEIETINNMAGGASTCANFISEAELLISRTTKKIKLVRPVEIYKNTVVNLTVKTSSKVWHFKFETKEGKFSHWDSFFAFSYIGNTSNTKEFFTQAIDSSFVLRPNNENQRNILKKLSPTVLFTWTPSQFNRKGDKTSEVLVSSFHKLGFSAGLTMDLSNPSVMIGPSLVIGDNIALSTGLTITSKEVLKGRYQEGQMFDNEVDFATLHESVYLAEIYFSIAYRFQSNIFKKSDN